MAMLDLKAWSLVGVWWSKRSVMEVVSVGEVEEVEDDILLVVGGCGGCGARCCAVVRVFGQK